ncbi:hypothetical protein HPB52_000146 [Rhipicephalus sanguineus]|uniref:Uncharacterized protein n=1 Tax=Rhipicephalus sanguineus TaxID=34632 RepID=A0A9D4Q4N1_RHISA|nr:hypothetical protein HPB52_000146 [Rhipicephalus sanguineus]
MVDKALDLLNTSSPISRGFKAPLLPSTFRYQNEAMEQAGRELMALQLAIGKPVVQHSRRRSVIFLAFTLKTVSRLAQPVFEADLCRGVVRHLHCIDCAQLLVSDTKATLLITLKDNGGLIEASAFVHAALCAAERLVRRAPQQAMRK